jgi:hypothetical protein
MSNSDNWTERLAVASIGEQFRVYAIIDGLSSPDHPLGDAIEVLVRLRSRLEAWMRSLDSRSWRTRPS